jgi:hypothetical protein
MDIMSTNKIRREIKEWIAGLESVTQFKIEVGDKAQSTQIASIDADDPDPFDMAGEILTVAIEAGWSKGDTRKIRIYAMDKNNKTRTFQRTLPENQNKENGIQSDVGHVMKSLESSLDKTLDTVIEMAQIHSASMATLSEVINHREHVSMALLEGFIDLSQDHADTQAANTVLEAIASDDAPANSYQQTATELLTGLVSQVTGLGGEQPNNDPPSEDQMRQWMEADPWFADTMRSMFKPKEEGSEK